MQEFVLDQLDSLAGQLGRHQRAMGDYVQQFEDWQPLRDEAERAEVERRRVGSSTRLGRLRDRMSRARGLAPPPLVEQMSDEALGVPLPPRVPRVPRGIYLHGSVGTGKSLLMDMLFAATGSTVKHRRRVHYAAFMLEIHRQKTHKPNTLRRFMILLNALLSNRIESTGLCRKDPRAPHRTQSARS